jgi:hypothetical protein
VLAAPLVWQTRIRNAVTGSAPARGAAPAPELAERRGAVAVVLELAAGGVAGVAAGHVVGAAGVEVGGDGEAELTVADRRRTMSVTFPAPNRPTRPPAKESPGLAPGARRRRGSSGTSASWGAMVAVTRFLL